MPWSDEPPESSRLIRKGLWSAIYVGKSEHHGLMTDALRLRPRTLVVLEGLDRSGKSTQQDRMANLSWAAPGPAFAHMPSGLTPLTRSIYHLTEEHTISSPLARQLLHLACHAENMAGLAAARNRGGLILDRWWWSTVAYGWYAGRLESAGVDAQAFFGAIDMVWAGQPADAVFLFMTPFEADELNRDEVRHGYATLAREHSEITITVPADTAENTTEFLRAELRRRGLLSLV